MKHRATHESVPRLVTDLIFVAITIYLTLNYVRTILSYVETPLVIIRESFFLVFLLMALAFIVVRSSLRDFTRRRIDYLYTVVGFSAPLFFQATPGGGPLIVGMPMEVVGLSLVVGSFISLNRSFGLAPENRGIKTGGPYRFVRHPMYLGYILSEAGFCVDNFSYLNLFMLTISILFLTLRLRAEEHLLNRDQQYKSYSKKVRWKLVPGVF